MRRRDRETKRREFLMRAIIAFQEEAEMPGTEIVKELGPQTSMMITLWERGTYKPHHLDLDGIESFLQKHGPEYLEEY
jgi:hypothetical protein